jgi:hypothetical protein
MRLLNRIAMGAPAEDNLENMDLELLQKFYGVDGDIQHPRQGTTGAGTVAEDSYYPPIPQEDGLHDDEPISLEDLSDREVATMNFIQEQLASQQQNHVRHPPIKVPRHHDPFNSSDEVNTFWEAVCDAEEEGYTPQGYGIHPDEWEEGVYPEIEVVRSGNRKQSELEIGLPSSIWFPRAVRWSCALHIMDFACDR